MQYKLEAVNYYHKALHLGCCSSPRSASGFIFINRTDQMRLYLLTYLFIYLFIYLLACLLACFLPSLLTYLSLILYIRKYC